MVIAGVIRFDVCEIFFFIFTMSSRASGTALVQRVSSHVDTEHHSLRLC